MSSSRMRSGSVTGTSPFGSATMYHTLNNELAKRILAVLLRVLRQLFERNDDVRNRNAQNIQSRVS